MDGSVTPPHQLLVQGDPDAAWSASVLLWRADRPVELVPLVFDGAEGRAVLEPATEQTRVLLVISQHKDAAHTPDAVDYDNLPEFTVSITWSDAAASDPGAIGGQDGPPLTGCAAAPGGATLLAMDVLLRR